MSETTTVNVEVPGGDKETTNDEIVKEKPTTELPAKPSSDEVPIVLVTGATGYVATHVIKQLLQEGRCRVRGSVRNSQNESKVGPLHKLVPNAAHPLELVEADLTDEEAWKGAVQGCTYVLHIASPFPSKQPKNEDEIIRPAVEGTLNVLKACSATDSTVKRVVLASSIAAVSAGMNGDPTKVHTEEDWSPKEACWPYEKSKLQAEQAAWEYWKGKNLNWYLFAQQ